MQQTVTRPRTRKLRIPTAEIFEPLLQPARYKGAYGGRGSGKSHFFAGLMVEDCVRERGMLGVCIREVQHTLRDSAKRLIESKLTDLGLGEPDGFKVYHDVIGTPGDGVINFIGMQNHTAESIKSLEGFKRAWLEEAHVISPRSLTLLRPTIRVDGSEIWAGWNPRRKNDPIDLLLRGGDRPTGAVVVRCNWNHNPWFPRVLEQERRDCLRQQPDQYDHIWEGGYASVQAGAYFARQLAEARADGRIGTCTADPLIRKRAFVDIGGAGARADLMSIWVVQWVGTTVRVLDYIEGQGQVLAFYANELRAHGHKDAICYLPHDGLVRSNVTGWRYSDHLRDAGFEVVDVPNQGQGAAMQRIEAARRLFGSCFFHEPTTAPGLESLGWYHEHRDVDRGVGLGPEHDWSSHACDAFGLMCICYEQPSGRPRTSAQNRYMPRSGSWMQM